MRGIGIIAAVMSVGLGGCGIANIQSMANCLQSADPPIGTKESVVEASCIGKLPKHVNYTNDANGSEEQWVLMSDLYDPTALTVYLYFNNGVLTATQY
jgi:hypothetical protein